MLSEKMQKSVDVISGEIRESKEYVELERQKKIVKASSEARDLIERARSIQKRLMELPDEEMNGDFAESLQNEYEEISENTVVYEYSRAESALVTLVREVIGSIIENVDIDI